MKLRCENYIIGEKNTTIHVFRSNREAIEHIKAHLLNEEEMWEREIGRKKFKKLQNSCKKSPPDWVVLYKAYADGIDSTIKFALCTPLYIAFESEERKIALPSNDTAKPGAKWSGFYFVSRKGIFVCVKGNVVVTAFRPKAKCKVSSNYMLFLNTLKHCLTRVESGIHRDPNSGKEIQFLTYCLHSDENWKHPPTLDEYRAGWPHAKTSQPSNLQNNVSSSEDRTQSSAEEAVQSEVKQSLNQQNAEPKSHRLDDAFAKFFKSQ